MKNLIIVFGVLGLCFFYGCNNNTVQTTETETPTPAAEKKSGETVLFDGTSTEGWRIFNGTGFPENWIIEDGLLKAQGNGESIENGGDLVFGAQEFENFELSLEWKISSGGNSGIFYHVQEGEDYKAAYQTGPEYQILDDAGFPETLNNVERAGADFAMHAVDPEQKNVKPAGEWNTSKLMFTAAQVQHWINGQKVVEFVPWSEDWNERKAGSKWRDVESYGAAKKGFIGLQDHGNEVWFRNIKIREL